MLWGELAESYDKCGLAFSVTIKSVSTQLGCLADQALASFTTLDDSIKRTETLLDKRCRVLNHETNGKGKKDVLKTLLERM
jgi:hypothetical protein